MKLKIILIYILLTVIVFAQDEKSKNPEVELPSFIITGRSQLNIKKVDKIAPDFVSSISEDFIKPTFSPEDLEAGSFSNPLKSDLSFLNDVSFFKGNIKAGVGLYTIPTLGVNYAHPFTNGIIEGMFDGDFTRAYIDNSDKYHTRLGFNLTYWTDTESEYFSGTQLNASGNYGTTGVKFYASDKPEQKRNINNGQVEIKIKNDYTNNFLFGLRFTDKFAGITQEEFSENNFGFKGEALLKLSAFNIGGTVDYRNHSIKNLIGNDSGKEFLLLRPTAGLFFTKLIKGTLGWTFSRAAGNTYNAVYASVALKLDKNLTVFGEYNPANEFQSPAGFLLQNNYLKVDSVGSIYWIKNNSFNASIKYEFDKYFQIDGGVKYFSSDAYPFFAPAFDSGKFILKSANVTSISPYADFLFYLGPYGEFYSSISLENITDKDGNNVPYIPLLNINAVYNFKMSNELYSTISMNYLSKRYADIANKNSIGDYIDFGFGLVYKFQPNLDLTLDIKNLFNQKNYLWNGYQDVPLNIIFGLNYRL